MTGGQEVDGELSIEDLCDQLASENVTRIVLVTQNPELYFGKQRLNPNITIHARSELDAVQKELREVKGVTVLIYEQECATNKRRKMKRAPKSAQVEQKSVFINSRVCEGCGDCGEKSNCLSVTPMETEFGRKRKIDQDACNKDFSCASGFCPSFVSVEGGEVLPPNAEDIPTSEALFKQLPRSSSR